MRFTHCYSFSHQHFKIPILHTIVRTFPHSALFLLSLPPSVARCLQLRLAADDALSDRIIHEVGLRESDTRKLTSMIIEREREIAALGA